MLVFCISVLAIFTGGCIDDLVPVNEERPAQDVSAYDFEVFLNNSFDDGEFIHTSTFYLSNDGDTKAVHILDNESVIDIIPLEDISSSSQEPVSNIVVLGNYSGSTDASIRHFTDLSRSGEPANINYTLSEDVIRGQKHIYITFSQPVTGFVAFTLATPGGQDFLHVTTPPSVVRFVLPEGHTTGNPLIGKANPEPDERYYDPDNRENLVWYNEVTHTGSILESVQRFSGDNNSQAEPAPKAISVKYYSQSAPQGLLIAAGILGLAALLVFSKYRRDKKRLKKIREDVENQFRNKKRRGRE
ncbi:hypothetical protein CUN85_02985 [Methanolobus halotolerans]|uniref:Uncharacterized protein n=2 Tax=Methanolobus halotolerans TaxID=2052935 RepID=A0A4E0PZP3_9EURY|nr:hypothetical protein CUN85_02985 [Methanolobus halotolerans]